MTKRPPQPAGLASGLRRAVGMIFLAVGIIGVILPIIPGWPGFFIAILLLGRRDPALRRLNVFGRQILRSLRRAPAPLLRRFGAWASREYARLRKELEPHLARAEGWFGAPGG